jgi:hypothetical protein
MKFHIILTAEQAAELSIELRKLRDNTNTDICISQLADALTAARYAKPCAAGEITVADGATTVDISGLDVAPPAAAPAPAAPPVKKQTAANNRLLSYVKHAYNGKIFARVTALVNANDDAGAIEYLCQFVIDEERAAHHTKYTALAVRS